MRGHVIIKKKKKKKKDLSAFCERGLIRVKRSLITAWFHFVGSTGIGLYQTIHESDLVYF